MRPVRATMATLSMVAILTSGAGQALYAADMNSFEALYEAAEAARKKAASVGFEWRDTAKILKQAKKTADQGDFEKAEMLAAQAKQQGEAAFEQSAIQESAWKAAVVR